MRSPLTIAALLLASCAGSEGPAGPVGPSGPVGTPPALTVGAGLTGDGSPAHPLAVEFGTSGAATTCSRADHEHGAADLGPGALGAGVTLAAGSVVGIVAEASHAARADDAAHLGGRDAASYLTSGALAAYVTAAAADARYAPLASYATAADLADYARLTDVPVLSAGKLPLAYLPASVPLLDGGGLLPEAVLPPRGATLRFQSSRLTWTGTLAPGEPGPELTARLENRGDESVDAPSVLWASPGFAVDPSACSAPLAAGASCNVAIQAEAGAAGTTRTGVVVASGGTGAVLGIVVTYQ